ncbi:MAG: porin family protein [Nitrospirota bacterium]|nr:porin family protein [Nitrospirota bacterium]
MKQLVGVVAIVFSVLMLANTSYAFDWDKEQHEFSVKLGMVLESEVYIDPPDRYFDTDAGTMLAIRADAVVSPKLSVGGFFHQITNSTGAGDDITTNAIGGTMKYRANLTPDLQLRPGVSLGYNFLITSDAFRNDATGLEIGAFLEAAYHLRDGHMLNGEIGFVTQPAGGNSDIDMTYGPTWYLLVGYAFGK